MRLTKYDEERRSQFFKSLSNTTLVSTSSCEWYAEKCETDFQDYEPQISPLLFERTVKEGDLVSLAADGKVYGFMVVDLEKGPGSEKWEALNWPPIMQKSEICYDDLPEWMKELYDSSEFPKETIVQRMHAKKLLLHTSLLRFYLENGFYVTKLHKFYEYQGAECFKKVFRTVYEARVAATETKDELKATAVKLVSNSMYGTLLLVS